MITPADLGQPLKTHWRWNKYCSSCFSRSWKWLKASVGKQELSPSFWSAILEDRTDVFNEQVKCKGSWWSYYWVTTLATLLMLGYLSFSGCFFYSSSFRIFARYSWTPCPRALCSRVSSLFLGFLSPSSSVCPSSLQWLLSHFAVMILDRRCDHSILWISAFFPVFPRTHESVWR